MNNVQNILQQTPIEIALGIDENGMTTARKLYDFLELNPSNYSKWYKTNIIENEFATENEDYFINSSSSTSLTGRGNTQDFKLTAHFAKKLSMKGSGEKAEQAREYFTRLEERTKELAIDRSQLSPQMRLMNMLVENMSRQELEQKRQAEQIQRIEQNQETMIQAFGKESLLDFRPWVNKCITAIAESPNYPFIGSREERYQSVRKESYERLNRKKPCRLKQRVESEKGRALNAGASSTRVNSINKLTIIENDKALKPIYETVLKEMMIAYCVDAK